MAKIHPAELENLAKQNPLAFGISHIDLLDGKQWSIQDRKWAVEPYLAANPFDIENDPIGRARRVAYEKSTQAGISTLSITRALHFAVHWSVRIGYMLPRLKDVSDFSSTRLDPTIEASEYLRGLKGMPDSVATKKLANSYLFFMEGTVEPRSMPMDALFLDEVDLCDPDHVGTALNRLDASPWKLITYLSTPTLPNYGIDALFSSSDQREWVVPCPHCGHKQELDWEENLKVEGPANEPTNVSYVCRKCKKPLTLVDIQEGEWVPRYPSKSNDLLGYHISQMMTTPALELYKHFRDPNQSTAEFYRKRLGKPYTMIGGSISRDDFMVNCFDDQYDFDRNHDGASTYYMGVDQGNQLQLVVYKMTKGSSRRKVVHIELVPFDAGFDRVGQLMKLFKVRRAVIDGDPNRHSVKMLQKDFPGRILLADYIEQRDRFTAKKTEGSKVFDHITINRTESFDDLIESIKDGEWALPGNPSSPPPVVEVLIDQVTSLRRDIEKRKTPSGEIEAAVWRKLRADHMAHAMLYAKLASDMDKGRKFRTTVAAAKESTDEEETAEKYSPKPDVIAALVAQFAEVPKKQLQDYLAASDKEEYSAPFPLKYKLGLVVDSYDAIDINWVIEFLSRQ